MNRILIMGLPGAGKTTLALSLIRNLHKSGKKVEWLNADDVRKQFNDWDFSNKGRLRQATRMRELADNSTAEYVIADFVCPLVEMRDIYNADFTVWLNTINEGRFEDTNKIFVPPENTLELTTKDADYQATVIMNLLGL